jgi:hypothetical protein
VHLLTPRIAAVLLVALAPTALAAQGAGADSQARTRRGFWIGLSPGVGTAWQECGGCPDEAQLTGATFSASVGWGLDDRWVVTLEPYVWISGSGAFTPEQDDEIQRSDFAVHAIYYPHASSGTFGRFGIGYSAYWTTIDTPERRADGLALSLGAGHDWRLSRRLVLRGQAVAHVGFLGPVRGWNAGLHWIEYAPSATQYILGVDLGLFFHPD